MLVELHIQNFALVEDLRIEIGAGFDVLTGETGAGKSIIVDALSTALGERTGTEVIRTGAEKCVVEAVFDISGCPSVVQATIDYGFEAEDNTLIVSREIARSGRSQARVNGRAATASVLREITSRLVDVHGQHEHQSLLSVPLHLEILDSWIGENASALRTQVEALHGELCVVRNERDRLRTDERERARLLDLYKFQSDEIDAAQLLDDEEESLATEKNRLANAERLSSGASEVYEALVGNEAGVVDGLGQAAGIAEKLERLDPSASSLVELLNAAFVSAQEAGTFARGYLGEIETNPARLEHVDERLELIRVLKRKYGDSIVEVLNYGAELADKIDGLANADERSIELLGRISELESELTSACSELTELRKQASSEFQMRVESELSELAMDKTTFAVSIEPSEPGPKGADAVEFLISPNPGEPVKPLARIASGGEMSRIMLALKTVMARSEVPTLVFDEIDTGIGGRTAIVLGDKLASLAKKCQVVCVTHLPQIASRANTHYSVSKAVENGRTCVRLDKLEGEARVAELARMLGADETSDAATQHAREMLSFASPGNT